MRIGSKRQLRLPNGSVKKAAKLRKHIGDAQYFYPIRNRLKAIWLTQHLLVSQRDLYKGIESFEPLVESIDHFLSEVDACEGTFLLAAWGEIDPLTLEDHVQEFVEDFHEAIVDPVFDDYDLQEYSERAWSGISRLASWLQDAVRGAHDSGYPDLWRLDEFKVAMDKLVMSRPEEEPSPENPAETAAHATPRKFSGDAWVQDECFTCHVDRMVVNGSFTSIQMSCSDDGGPHTAEGAFELQGGVWHTRTFSVRYTGDAVNTRAEFHLSTLEIAQDGQSARFAAEWLQGGETYLIDADLEKS